MSHYEQRLEADLAAIREHTRRLSTAAHGALQNALQSLLSGNRKLAYTTILGDAWINVRSRELDAHCHRLIARHLPSAGHLRYMSAVIRTALQLERLGDYAVTIAREGVQLSTPLENALARQLELVSDQAIRMLGKALDAFHEGNAEAARAAMDLGASMENILDEIYADLASDPDAARTKDLLALFVVFNMIKRVSDQAKNICEETLFTVTGEIKRPSVHSVLFLDEDNACLSQLAEAIAQKNHSGRARFASAGQTAAAAIDVGLKAFLEDLGFDLGMARPKPFSATPESLSAYFVVVSLDGPIERYAGKIPFHTSVLEWDLGPGPGGLEGEALQARYTELYREISAHVRDLVETLCGDERDLLT